MEEVSFLFRSAYKSRWRPEIDKGARNFWLFSANFPRHVVLSPVVLPFPPSGRRWSFPAGWQAADGSPQQLTIPGPGRKLALSTQHSALSIQHSVLPRMDRNSNTLKPEERSKRRNQAKKTIGTDLTISTQYLLTLCYLRSSVFHRFSLHPRGRFRAEC